MPLSKEEQPDRLIAELWIAIMRIMKNMRNMSGRLVEEYDLTQPQVVTLWQLKESGPVTMGELSGLLMVTHGVATRMVDRLLKKGMVERHRDGKDRRVVLISLTELGSAVTDEVVEDAMKMIAGALKNVPQHDREEFLTLLGRIEEAQAGGSPQ